jgi:hypothetical protein
MNVFIVPSCIRSLIGQIPFEERYNLTFNTFKSIKKQVPDAIIIFCDSSIGGLSIDKKNELSSHVDYYLDYSDDPIAQNFNQRGLKSFGEIYLLRKSIEFAKLKLDLNQPGRMFKLGARYILLDSFTLDDYKDADGKFVFKKRTKSWMEESIQKEYDSPYILETLLYSWSLFMTDEYLEIIDRNFEYMIRGSIHRFDTEHAHFFNVPKDKLLEFDRLNAGGHVAGYTSSYYVEQ